MSLLVKKNLYGLKQSGRNRNSLLHKFFDNLNFNQSIANSCLYTKFENDNVIYF